MKIILAAGLTLALLTGHAIAQTAPQPPGMEDDHPGADHTAPQPPHGEMMQERGRPHGGGKSARFRLQVGDIFLGLTCPEDEPMRACAEFALQLLDKAESIERH